MRLQDDRRRYASGVHGARRPVLNDRLRHRRIGYARVSKADGSQSLDLQRDALQAAGVDAVHLKRGGHRHANAALYRAVIVRMRFHQPTRDDVARRTADGRTKREIIRCLKRFLAREIYQRVMTDFRTRQAVTQAN